MKARDSSTLLLDVRNCYESAVGHFEGATCPSLEAFRDFPAYAHSLTRGWDRATTSVLMYCTGGIRCEFYSALLRSEGFERVYQLEGGVIGYGLEVGDLFWRGRLFVFDDRLVVSVGRESGAPIASCCHCGEPNDCYYNCANVDCNELFLSCLPCLHKGLGCCSSSCLTGRLRPYREDARPFRRLSCERTL